MKELPALQKEAAHQYAVRVRNISATLMAWWLDPAHNQPPALALPQPQGDQAPLKKEGKTPFSLPAGVERVAPIETQNTLLVLANSAGLKELQNIIAVLDRPLRQVEVEAQFVQMSPADIKLFGIDFGEETAAPQNQTDAQPLKVGFVRGNMQATLTTLLAQKRAKVLNAPRVTAINNLPASLSVFRSRSLISLKDDNTQGNTLSKDHIFSLGTEVRFAVTPTVNNDDTVTLLLSPASTLQLKDKGRNRCSRPVEGNAGGSQC